MFCPKSSKRKQQVLKEVEIVAELAPNGEQGGSRKVNRNYRRKIDSRFSPGRTRGIYNCG
jgi:hypothetical protein